MLDPCLDDCVMFAKRLKKLNNSVGLDILPGLPHGFLNFAQVRICIKKTTTVKPIKWTMYIVLKIKKNHTNLENQP